ncbi:hypothetical protein Ocin01_19507 [Orchesella cincta]|uniref:Secreted protein n=1 Tax=Orchesella cincta TaxID=48709 RepID=A0A1D2M2H7_ORCCI|nr:hypothetical protein Ocin01_19507 [Orchesella cincta]
MRSDTILLITLFLVIFVVANSYVSADCGHNCWYNNARHRDGFCAERGWKTKWSLEFWFMLLLFQMKDKLQSAPCWFQIEVVQTQAKKILTSFPC